jgi:hypothetical protein
VLLLLSLSAYAATRHHHVVKHSHTVRHISSDWHPAFPPTHESLLRQNAEIDRYRIERIRNEKQLREFVASGDLVAIPVGLHLTVDRRLPANRRYVRAWTAQFLVDLSEDYYQEFHHPIQVNSAVRPMDVQSRLRRVNHNAAAITGEAASSHMAGLTVDLERRRLSPAQIRFVQTWLRKAYDKGLVEVEEERFHPCFHIMVSKQYGNPFILKYFIVKTPSLRYSTPMSYYQKLIVETLACTPTEATKIEDVMRHDIFNSTLDWQTKEQLQEGARQAVKLIKKENL